jgi:hypothetical protein
MLELTDPFLLSPSASSRRNKGRGHPYGDLATTAHHLADGLERRASTCQSSSERRRLRVLWAATCRIADCLAQTGCPLE